MLEASSEWLRPKGLIIRGGFQPEPEDGLPAPVRHLPMIGNAGPAMWPLFAADWDGQGKHPMDRWTEAVGAPT